MQIDVILDTRASADELAELGCLAEAMRHSRRLGLQPAGFTRSVYQSRGTGPVDDAPASSARWRSIHSTCIRCKIASAFLTLNELAGRAERRLVVGGGGEALAGAGHSAASGGCGQSPNAWRSSRPPRTGAERELCRRVVPVRNLRLGWLRAAIPPVFVGASQTQMLRMAAGVADGIMMSDMPASLTAQTIATLDDGPEGARHNRARPGFATNAFTAWHVYDDADEARREARRWLLLRGIFRPWLLADFPGCA